MFTLLNFLFQDWVGADCVKYSADLLNQKQCDGLGNVSLFFVK